MEAEVSDPLELELQMVMNQIELWSSGRAVHTPNHESIPAARESMLECSFHNYLLFPHSHS